MGPEIDSSVLGSSTCVSRFGAASVGRWAVVFLITYPEGGIAERCLYVSNVLMHLPS